ncbi:MarR family winged helix-turn-helix transcriptional regulator [Micromonospora sp. LOL_023]|uniref:MarR family winged helix-turn-helix transcriptional regulator n=1 Tax=Micromonospora sp. LOL_023 TaxID=3345418 RepID=UPI003A88BF90
MSDTVVPPPPGPDQHPTSDDLGWSLGVVFRAFVKASSTILGDFPGGPRGHQVLTAAVRGAPESQIALARRLGIDKTVMTYLIDDLERAGLVERRPNPGDRRHKQVVVTDLGRQAWSSTSGHLEHAEEHLLGPLDPNDRAILRSLLHRLATQAQQLDPVTDTCQIVADLNVGTEQGGN